MGASHVGWGREPSCDLYSFQAAFNSANISGLSQGIVRELVRSNDIDDILLDFWQQLRDEYYSYPGPPWQQSWWFDLRHRQRFLVGGMLKIIALRSWPVLPYVNQSIIQLAAVTPLSILSDRKVQIELMRRKFPELTRLPLARDIDRKCYTIMPRRTQPWPPMIERVKDSISWHYHNKFKSSEHIVFCCSA